MFFVADGGLDRADDGARGASGDLGGGLGDVAGLLAESVGFAFDLAHHAFRLRGSALDGAAGGGNHLLTGFHGGADAPSHGSFTL